MPKSYTVNRRRAHAGEPPPTSTSVNSRNTHSSIPRPAPSDFFEIFDVAFWPDALGSRFSLVY